MCSCSSGLHGAIYLVFTLGHVVVKCLMINQDMNMVKEVEVDRMIHITRVNLYMILSLVTYEELRLMLKYFAKLLTSRNCKPLQSTLKWHYH